MSRQFLNKPLAHVINSSFISGMFPNILKIAKIKPLFKKNDPGEVENYRPISLLTCFSKIFEKVMSQQIISFLESNQLLAKEQHGFRSEKSVITAGIDYIDAIIDSLDKGDLVAGVFMDMTKAFDSVSHPLLLEVLSSLGISGSSLSWLNSYLNGRKQFVEIKHVDLCNKMVNVHSKLSEVKYGVPQGSVLGPLLFIIYLNGLPLLGDEYTKMCIYADDINIKIHGKTLNSIEISSFAGMTNIKEYLNNFNMLINYEKTKYMVFSPICNNKAHELQVLIDDNMLESVDCSKFLGLQVDKSLSWDTHVKAVCKKMSSGIFALRRMLNFCTEKTLKLIYYSFIHSHLSFGLILYGGTSVKNLNAILLLQKESIRVMCKLNWDVSVKNHFKDMGIMTVYSLYIFQLILYVHKNADSLPKLGN